jgi:hypothetical protein
MDLVRKTRSTYNQVQSDLRILEREGFIVEECRGRLRMISLNRENPKTHLVLEALKLLNDLQKAANNK